jgi:hypothetical protein
MTTTATATTSKANAIYSALAIRQIHTTSEIGTNAEVHENYHQVLMIDCGSLCKSVVKLRGKI